MHVLNKEALVQCHLELPNKRATGINGTTKEQYGESLEEKIEDLVIRLKSKSYRPVPVRRMYIPKLNFKTDNTQNVNNFKDKIEKVLFKWLNRRSQRKSFTWDKFSLFLNKYLLPSPRIKVNIYALRK